MDKLRKNGNLRFSMRLAGIFLVCLICLLSFLDADEYVHCSHIGICEFLDLKGNVNGLSCDEAENLINQNNIIADYCQYYFKKLLVHNMAYRDRLSLSIYYLSEYINPLKKILYPPSNKAITFLINQEYTVPSIDCFISQNLQIIATSSIKS